MRIAMAGALLVGVLTSRPAGAQTFEHLNVDVLGNTVGVSGGEQTNTAMSTGPLVIGKTTTAGFAKLPDQCGFGVAARLVPGGFTSWSVEVTPLEVDGEAVRFRLWWVRSRDKGTDTTTPRGEIEVTMRPGESLPIDMAPVPPSLTMPYECGVRAVTLRVGVSHWPRSNDDRRLAATDLWLIERAPDGTERSQALSLRGRFNERTSFYFDPIVDGGTSLDFYGELAIHTAGDGLRMKLETRSRVTQNGQSSTILRDGRFMRSREVTSDLQLTPGEVVDVELPRLSENEAGAFANRTFAIRVRARQIR
jgi:hypothetical protein